MSLPDNIKLIVCQFNSEEEYRGPIQIEVLGKGREKKWPKGQDRYASNSTVKI